MDKSAHIVIIGAGVFGLGAALTLKEQGYTSVTVLDRSMPPVPDGSSNDISRVIRFDYGDAVYARIAKEAFDLWKTKDYSDAFHETPTIWLTQDAVPGQPTQPRAQEYSIKTRQVLTDMGLEWHTVKTLDEARERFPELDKNMNIPGFDAFYNTNAGWSDAGKAISRLASRCAAAGVSFITGPNGQVTDFEKNADGSIKNVVTVNGNKVFGDRFICATGAWTASLVPAWNSMLAAGQVVGYLRLTPEETAKLRNMPIWFNFSTGFFCFPPHEGSGYLKTAVHGFGYTQQNETAAVSSPSPSAVASRANFVPPDGEERLLAGLRDIFPELAKRGYERTGLCWYNDTPTGDFILDYHPEHKNLFIATGGSGHAFKFLPVIGKYIVGSFERSLPRDLLEKWQFPRQFRDKRQDDVFAGDGSRGGPERRELSVSERASFNSALALSSRQSKI